MGRAFIITFSIFLLLHFHLPAQITPEGVWQTRNEKTGRLESLVRIWIEDEELKGKMIRIFPAPGEPADPVCQDCPGEWQGKPLIGMTFMWGFRFKEGRWVDGRILDGRTGRTYRSRLELSRDGKTLKLFGFVQLVIRIGKTSVWTRLE